jgi:hypothetical protein
VSPSSTYVGFRSSHDEAHQGPAQIGEWGWPNWTPHGSDTRACAANQQGESARTALLKSMAFQQTPSCGYKFQEIKKFARPLGLTCVAVFGGSGVANQISELKRGTEVIVCTPGRMIDLLVTSNGGYGTLLPSSWCDLSVALFLTPSV